MIRVESCCFLECKDQVEEVTGSVGSGLVSLHRRDILSSWFFAVSKNRRVLGGAVSPVNKAPSAKALRIQKIRIDI